MICIECIWGPITCRNAGAKIYWAKEMTPYVNSNLQEKMKRADDNKED